MTDPNPLPFSAALEEYEQQAQALFDGLKSGEQEAEWRFKWEHPRFRGKTVDDVRAATLNLDDARLVIAHVYAFEDWPHLEKFAEAVRSEGEVTRFETAVEAVISGDATAFRAMLRQNPELVGARSSRRHHATRH